LIQEAFASARVALQPKDPTWARIMGTAALIAQQRGDRKQAIHYAEHALSLLKTQDGTDPTRGAAINKTLSLARAMPERADVMQCPLAEMVVSK
jgi:hypothetical protein